MSISLILSGEEKMYGICKFNRFLLSLPELKLFPSAIYLKKHTKLLIFVRSFYLEDCGRYCLRNTDNYLPNYQTTSLNKYRHGYVIYRKPDF
jgi:hypothetical protein